MLLACGSWLLLAASTLGALYYKEGWSLQEAPAIAFCWLVLDRHWASENACSQDAYARTMLNIGLKRLSEDCGMGEMLPDVAACRNLRMCAAGGRVGGSVLPHSHRGGHSLTGAKKGNTDTTQSPGALNISTHVWADYVQGTLPVTNASKAGYTVDWMGCWNSFVPGVRSPEQGYGRRSAASSANQRVRMQARLQMSCSAGSLGVRGVMTVDELKRLLQSVHAACLSICACAQMCVKHMYLRSGECETRPEDPSWGHRPAERSA
eukprot:1156435-Pelagomonas_calceolata.AAC.6